MGSYIRVYNDGGGIRHCPVPDDYSGLGSQPFVLDFPGFRKSLLASLVASSTAARTSDIVTITATAHGIPTGSTYVGFRFFYPGSPSLIAGWYDSILSIPDANTITFNAPGANFTSESINGGAIYTTLTDVASVVIPGSFILEDTHISAIGYRGGDTTSNTKQVRTYCNSLNTHTSNTTTSPFGRFIASNVLVSGNRSHGSGGPDNLWSATEYLQAINLNTDLTYSVKISSGASAGFVTITGLKILLN